MAPIREVGLARRRPFGGAARAPASPLLADLGGARGDGFPAGCSTEDNPSRPAAARRAAAVIGEDDQGDAGGRRRIATGGRTATAELNPNSLRKAIATIREHGASAVAVVLQGSLSPGDVLEQAGISAQGDEAGAQRGVTIRGQDRAERRECW